MLFELIYRSEANPNVSDDDLLNILSAARSFNNNNDLTGCLLYNNKHFVQILEGEFNTVNELYGRIKQDSRHHNVMTLHMKEIKERSYPDWNMAFKALETEDMNKINNALGIKEFEQLTSINEESPITKQLFWTVTQSIM